MNKRITATPRSHRRSGAVLVEFALVAPIFFILILGGFEFARLNILRNTANNAAYEGARVAMVPGGTAQDAIDEANRILNAVGTRSANVTTDPLTLDDNTLQFTVIIEIPFAANAWMTPIFCGNSTIRTTSTLQTERYTGIGS